MSHKQNEACCLLHVVFDVFCNCSLYILTPNWKWEFAVSRKRLERGEFLLLNICLTGLRLEGSYGSRLIQGPRRTTDSSALAQGSLCLLKRLGKCGYSSVSLQF